MLVKTPAPTPIKPRPACGQAGNKVVQPIRCAAGGEVFVHQVNQPDPVGDGVNRKNKDGVLALGDDGQCLRNVRVDPDGTTVVRHDGPIDVTLKKVMVKGTVRIDKEVSCKPIVVANMPNEMRIQENLHIIQTPVAAKVAPFNFAGYGAVILSRPCRIYSVHLTVYEPTYIELVDITGEMWTRELKFNLFPQFIQVDKLEVKAKEYVEAGGYILYENC
jgi:hypothetical protein